MGCATEVVRITVFVFNFCCTLIGLALITVGAIAYATIDNADDATGENYLAVPSTIIVLGVVIFFISFLGCCGVCQKNNCMITTYAVILILLFLAQFILGVYAAVHVKDEGDFRTEFIQSLNKSFVKYGNDTAITDYFNLAQEELKCCGVNNYTDYQKLLHKELPLSCCQLDGQTNSCTVSSQKLFKEGCGQKIFEKVQSSIHVIAYVALGICAIELVGSLFAFCLVNSYKNEERRGV